MTTIYLVRHGRTEANEKGIFAGRTDDPLLHEGRKGAERAAQMLADKNISSIYTSPVRRAWETADIIGNLLKRPVIEEDALSDLLIPSWEGRLKTDLAKDPASGYSVWKETPERFVPQDGETLHDLQARAMNAINNIFSNHENENTVVVTHLAVARCILAAIRKISLSEYRNIEIFNTVPIAIMADDAHIVTRDKKIL